MRKGEHSISDWIQESVPSLLPIPPSFPPPLYSLSLKSLGMLTSTMSPNGINAACSISSVHFSSRPPEEGREGGRKGGREERMVSVHTNCASMVKAICSIISISSPLQTVKGGRRQGGAGGRAGEGME